MKLTESERIELISKALRNVPDDNLIVCDGPSAFDKQRWYDERVTQLDEGGTVIDGGSEWRHLPMVDEVIFVSKFDA